MSANIKNEKHYYTNTRLDLLSLLTKKEKKIKVLEVGAGRGNTLLYLKEKGIASEVIGIDINDWEEKDIPDAIDTFISGNIEELTLPQYSNYFDLIIFADVLEHLIHPGEVLKKMKDCLKDDGEILISIPNFRHKKALFKVFIKGDFSYENSGLFDATHLRFFCKRNIRDLIKTSDLKIDNIKSSLKSYNGFSPSKIFNMLTLGIFEEFLTVQYLVKARKITL